MIAKNKKPVNVAFLQNPSLDAHNVLGLSFYLRTLPEVHTIKD